MLVSAVRASNVEKPLIACFKFFVYPSTVMRRGADIDVFAIQIIFGTRLGNIQWVALTTR